MNNIKLDMCSFVGADPKQNVFELRQKIYKELIDKIYSHIDYLYDKLVNDQKAEEIKQRSIKAQINKESRILLYKGIDIPMMDKTCIVLDNIEYIPIFQMVDKPVHLQKDGKYIVIKNNVRNTFLKLDGKICCALYKNAHIPLLPYLLYIFSSVRDMLTKMGYTILDPETVDVDSEDVYIVPEYYEHTFLIVKNDFEPGTWKHYFLSPFTKKHYDFHQKICNLIIDTLNNNIIPQLSGDGSDIANNIMRDVVNTSIIDEKLRQMKEKRKNVDQKNMREYTLLPHNKDQETLDKIFSIINIYHEQTRTVKKNLTKMYLETSLYKYTCKDITMNNITIFDTVIENVTKNNPIPLSYSITDVSQKDLRFLEWYALKLSSVRSYPEQNLIMEVAKTEQKRIYNNSVNPITELSMMSRVNLFGKGALPRESCSSQIRNLHDSYFGVLDPICSPSGQNIGISLHLTPEIYSTDMRIETSRLKDNNMISKLYALQFEDLNTEDKESSC